MWCNDFIKIPFAELGRSREGADCWGLVRIVYEEMLGLNLPSYLDYSDTKDAEAISGMISDQTVKKWKFIEPGDERPYDCAVFKMAGIPMHVGVVVESGMMIHCERGCGTYVTYYNKEKQWHRRLEGFFRYADNSNLPPPV